jgi:hypothetical protein
MNSLRRVWILCAFASAVIFVLNCSLAFDALKAVDGVIGKTGQIRLVSIGTTTTKGAKNSSMVSHVAVLRFRSDDTEAELLKFPGQAFQSNDYNALSQEVSALTRHTALTAYCSRTSASCYMYAGVATNIKIWLLLSLASLAIFVALAFKAKATVGQTNHAQ